jgi:ATP-dependent DNA ligase
MRFVVAVTRTGPSCSHDDRASSILVLASAGQLHAFDILALAGDDLRPLPLSMRKAHLGSGCWRAGPKAFSSALSSKVRSGRISSAKLASSASRGLVSKRKDRPYRSGRAKDWIKMKNRSHPAMERVKESFS